MAETLSTIAIISYIASGLFAVVSIVLWIVFKIPSVIDDLSLKSARKSIKQMRNQDEKSGKKSYRSSTLNTRRGKLAGKIDSVKNHSSNHVETGILNENRAEHYQSKATGLLVDEEETGLLDNENTTKMSDQNQGNTKRKEAAVHLTIIEEIMYIHTKEVI